MKKSIFKNFILGFLLTLLFHCGGSGVDLDGTTSNITNNDDTEISTETVEDNEVIEEEEITSDIDAPEVNEISSTLVSVDCSEKEQAGDPDEDYAAVTCEANNETLVYYYYCVEATESEDGDFIVEREDSEDASNTERLFETTLVTCQEDDDGTPLFFEEDFIVS